jgi:GAF domain-containing protein
MESSLTGTASRAAALGGTVPLRHHAGRIRPKLDLITELAIKSVGAEIGGISIVYQSQIWLPSRVAWKCATCRAPARLYLVVGAASEADFFEVEDAASDARFRDNPLVTHAPHFHHYAAVPLLARAAICSAPCG